MPDSPLTLNYPTSLDTVVSGGEVANRAFTTLSNTITDTALSIPLTDSTLFPATGVVTLTDSLTAPTKTEDIIYTANSANALTVPTGGRGAFGSTAQNWSGTVYVRMRMMAEHHEWARDAIIQLETIVGADATPLASRYATISHNHSGVYEPANANIQAHIASTSNPHSVTKSQVGLGSVEDTALSTWAGSTNLTTLGTISAGTWNGAVIGEGYGGAGTINGILKADGSGVVSAAVAGTDYLSSVAGLSGDLQMNNGSGGLAAARINDNGTTTIQIGADTDNAGITLSTTTGIIDFGDINGLGNSTSFNLIDTSERITFRAIDVRFIVPTSGNVGIKVGADSAADTSSILDLQSTAQGFLPPRMTTAERDAIAAPAEGLVIHNTTTNAPNYYTGAAWSGFGGATTALDNLASVSINASLIPQTTLNLGAQATPWKNLWLYGGGTFGSHSIKLDGTPTGHRTITFPDATDTVAVLGTAQTWTANQTFGSGNLIATSAALTTPAITTSATVTRNSLGATTATGLELKNTTAAAAGAQQVSPATVWTGEGWKTNATAGTQTVNFQAYVLPVQGAANPSAALVFNSQINGGGYSSLNAVVLKSDGGIHFYSPTSIVGSIRTDTSNFGLIFHNTNPNVWIDTTKISLRGGYRIAWPTDTTTPVAGASVGIVNNANGVDIDSGTAIGTTAGNARDLRHRASYFIETGSDPSASDLTIAGSNTKDVFKLYMKNDKVVISYNNSGTVTYLTIPLDGATTAWSHSTTAP